MSETNWHGKPYYSLDAYCKNVFHRKCYRIALNAHMTCPNRDGTLDTRGCLFCSGGGSGEFAVDFGKPGEERDLNGISLDVERQLQEGIQRIAGKLGRKNPPYIIAYFQAYTNTYAPVPYLEQVFTQALSHPMVCGISIATRPDCLPNEALELLKSLKERFPGKFVWVELGLQTIHDKTAILIRRGYELSCFETALNSLRKLDIPVIVHIILGLPGETREQMLKTISYLNDCDIFGVKLQLLHVLEGTDLAELYKQGAFQVLAKDVYLNLLVDCLEHLSPQIVVHRVTGDGPKRLLIAPEWSKNKKDVLNSLHRLMKDRDARQGGLWSKDVPDR